ncbi:class I SAM-dependent methyltransferase [Brachyspira pilosicoli]|uniref:class I SAM-dependent methyltransferase n=1 Tax=Brachyspira pilosicoli TaxID=52584 RepID=UPI001F55086C|nr:class I SAM-dependent methyltransferase [Brachyspira pilosicoli]
MDKKELTRRANILNFFKYWSKEKTKTQKKIDNIVNFIPTNKLKKYCQTKLYKKYQTIIEDEKIEYMAPTKKYKFHTMFIKGDNIEDNKKLELVEKILINEEDRGQYILHNYFINNKSNAIHKPFSYFDLYQKYFSRFKGRDINLLEIGVQNGGSTRMWEYYFKKINPDYKIKIFGVDIDPKCKQLDIENENIKIFIGSQSDRIFLRKLKSEIPKIDILIDDGGHHMQDQIITFEEMYESIKDDGIYWCEDVGTSYSKGYYAAGYKNPNSYIEYCKNLIDYINAYNASADDTLEVSDFTNTAYGIYFHENVVVIEKKLRNNLINTIANDAAIGDNYFL